MKRRSLLVLIYLVLMNCVFAETREDEVRSLLNLRWEQTLENEQSDLLKQMASNVKLLSVRRFAIGESQGETWLGIWTEAESLNYSLELYLLIDSNIENGVSIESLVPDAEDWSHYQGSELEKQIGRFKIDSRMGFIYDFNRDGYDEILNFFTGGESYACELETVDPITFKQKYLFSYDTRFDVEECPFEFAKYNGQRGIKVHKVERMYTGKYDEVLGDPLYELKHEWLFYTWNESEGKYTKVEGIPEDELKDLHGGADFFDHDVPVVRKNAVKKEVLKSPPVRQSKVNQSQLILLPFAALVSLVLSIGGIVVVFFVKRRKKDSMK